MLKRVACALMISGMMVPAQAQQQAPVQDSVQPVQQKAAPPAAGEMNERVCENITPIGSRLATKRFCGTRAEWADRKRQDREALEAAQRGPCVLTHNGGTGKPAC
jgi:cytochrome c5